MGDCLNVCFKDFKTKNLTEGGLKIQNKIVIEYMINLLQLFIKGLFNFLKSK